MFVATCSLQATSIETPADFHKKIKKFFPEWKRSFTQVEPEFREGNHTFKVSFNKEVWRRIVVPANASLEQLADTILAAFKFKCEHLYQFQLRDSNGLLITIVGPHINDATHFADEMQIGELPLLIGDSMVFHYDFRVDWRFKVTLEAIVKGKAKGLKVIEQSGATPKQDDRHDW